MGREDRNGKQYYYRKRREGGRVVSEYVGGGLTGEIAAAFDASDRWEAEKKRLDFQDQKGSVKAIDGKVNEIEEYTKAFTRACLLLAGYHAPRRQWRKRRDVE